MEQSSKQKLDEVQFLVDGIMIKNKRERVVGPLFSVEEGKDMLAGHEAFLHIAQLQVVHLQHVLLLLLLQRAKEKHWFVHVRETQRERRGKREGGWHCSKGDKFGSDIVNYTMQMLMLPFNYNEPTTAATD